MELPYDGDTNDDSQYCEHGTFIGSWWGPDYLCQWCEDGISVDEQRCIQVQAALKAYKGRIRRSLPVLARNLTQHLTDHRMRAAFVVRTVPLVAQDTELLWLQQQYRNTIDQAQQLGLL